MSILKFRVDLSDNDGIPGNEDVTVQVDDRNGIWWTVHPGFRRIARVFGGVWQYGNFNTNSTTILTNGVPTTLPNYPGACPTITIACFNGFGPNTPNGTVPIWKTILDVIAKSLGRPVIPNRSFPTPAFELRGVPMPINMTKMIGPFNFVDRPTNPIDFDNKQPIQWIRQL